MKVIETVSAEEDGEPLTDSEKLFLWPALIVCFCIAMAFLTWAWNAFT